MTRQAQLPLDLGRPDISSLVIPDGATMLDQSRLDVTTKTRSNIFNWRGQFTPQFVDYLIETFGADASTVADPFCGSGTVLLESASRGIAAYGTELHPAAYAMAKFSTLSSLSVDERSHVCKTIETHLLHVAVDYEDCPLWRTSLAFRDRARNLLNLGRALLERCDGELQTLIAVLVLFEAESRRKGSLVSALRQAFREIIDHLLNLPVLDTAPRVFCCDARNADRIIDTPCDLLVTSPPYINVFNYHQNHRAIVELLGFDVLGFARSEIGSNRKHRGNRFKTVVQYALDMERCLYVFNRLLKDRGVAVVVVGRESRVRGVPFKNGDIIMQLASAGDLLHIESLHERKYTNRFGTTIFEDILILRKQATARRSNVGRTIAEQALNYALSSATGDVRADIEEALVELDSIVESPVMHGICDF